MAAVSVHVYDLSMGMARVMSVSLVGKQVDIVPHTGIVVAWPGAGSKEYFFGGGVCVTPAGQAMGMPACEVIPLGATNKSESELQAFLTEISPRFTPQTYNLLSHNWYGRSVEPPACRVAGCTARDLGVCLVAGRTAHDVC